MSVRARWLLAVALIIHGVIHVIAFQAAWLIGGLEEFSPVPTFPSMSAGSAEARVVGALWLVAGLGFLATATLLVGDRPAWRPCAAAAAVLSLGVCLLWWHDAPVGAAVDLLILAVLAATFPARVRAFSFRPASAPSGSPNRL